MYKNLCGVKLVYLLVGIIFILGTIGCSTYKNRFEFRPSTHDRAAMRAIAENKIKNAKKGEKVKFDYKGMEVVVEDGVIQIKKLKISISVKDIKITISDEDALGFADDVSLILRKRMNSARRVRLLSSSLQVLTAAAAGSLGIIAHSDIETIAALGAVSAIIPELQSIIQADVRSRAYGDGYDLIQDAIARYNQGRMSKGGNGEISTDKLSEEGSNLMREVAASIKAVDKVLQSTIPSVEVMKAATGQLENKFNKFKIVPHNLHIVKGGTGVVIAIKDRIIYAAPKDASIVGINNEQFGNNGIEKVTIDGLNNDGDTVVEFYFDIGYKAEVDVKVGAGGGAGAGG